MRAWPSTPCTCSVRPSCYGAGNCFSDIPQDRLVGQVRMAGWQVLISSYGGPQGHNHRLSPLTTNLTSLTAGITYAQHKPTVVGYLSSKPTSKSKGSHEPAAITAQGCIMHALQVRARSFPHYELVSKPPSHIAQKCRQDRNTKPAIMQMSVSDIEVQKTSAHSGNICHA